MPYLIEVIKGDITQCTTDAIVNAANNEFWMGSGVAGAIKARGGDSIEKEAVSKGPVMPGEAVYTGAGRLRFKYIIHAAVMGQDLRTTDRLIRQSTVASLRIADKLKLKSVALPAFGTGVGRFPVKACANIMVRTVRSFESVADSLELVQLCLYDDIGFKLFSDALAEQTK